jgi:hypothetical protein
MSAQIVATYPDRQPKARSSLVRRLVHVQNDPAKERLREWLRGIDDERLLGFGLTPEDIAVLRQPLKQSA